MLENAGSSNIPVRIVPLGCLGVLALSLLTWSIWNKTKQAKDDEASYEMVENIRSSIAEIKVPADCVRRIIGTGGSNIKQIQTSTNTRINLRERESERAEDSDKTFVIRGSASNIQLAEIEIKKFVLDTAILLTEEYYVPEVVCGKIIGRNGASIKEMSVNSNCQIKLTDKGVSKRGKVTCKDIVGSMEELYGGPKKVLILSGSTEQIACAKALIVARINEEFKKRSGKMPKRNNKQHGSNDTISSSSSNLSISNNFNSIQLEKSPHTCLDLETCLDENKKCQIVVSALAHPAAFWVQVIKNFPIIEKISEDLHQYITENPNTFFKNIDEVKVGMIVAGSGPDNASWQRVKVNGFKEIKNTKMVDGCYVDHGDSAYLDVRHLRKLPAQFFELPHQAIECKLQDVHLSIKDEFWSNDAVDYFEKITDAFYKKTLLLTFVESREETSDPNLLLRYMLPKKKVSSVLLHDKEVSISDQLVKKGYCIHSQKGESKFKPAKEVVVEEDSESKGW